MAGFAYVDEVIGHGFAVNDVLREVLARPDVHASIDLARIGRDQLRADLGGKPRGQPRLARGRRPEDDDEFELFFSVSIDFNRQRPTPQHPAKPLSAVEVIFHIGF